MYFYTTYDVMYLDGGTEVCEPFDNLKDAKDYYDDLVKEKKFNHVLLRQIEYNLFQEEINIIEEYHGFNLEEYNS